MGLKHITFLVFTTLIAAHLIFAQNDFFDSEEFESHREVRSAEDMEMEEDEEEPQSRLFFARVVPCNYSAGSRICTSCRTRLVCLPSNVGLRRRCFPYCNNGFCSFIPGPQCNNTSG